ncbi:hypothetical protein PSEUDO9AG_40112 [Pseudomonas sp. 9Ag]|nr:hypothetical protein PSEUDO9AG_40112 [Pseudomonas sp. 9Ag]
MAGLYAPDGFANGTIASCSWLEESLISQTLDRSRERTIISRPRSAKISCRGCFGISAFDPCRSQ